MKVGDRVSILEEACILNITDDVVILQADNKIRTISRKHFDKISQVKSVLADVEYSDYYDLIENEHVMIGEVVAKFQAEQLPEYLSQGKYRITLEKVESNE